MSMLRPLIGHEAARSSLIAAASAGALPGSILLHGAAGIGKQRLGLWLAQLLACQTPGESGPCDACKPCRFALRLEHPDIHWFFPLARPKGASGPEKLAEALEEARAAELAARRASPLQVTPPAEMRGIFLAQVQTLRRLAHARPAMGARKVFLIGEAEYLVPQESSQEAANALLKLLEEPPPETTFILTATDPASLLDTIRSRLLPIRLRPLPVEDVARFLIAERGATEAEARLAARLSEGSIGRALGFLPTEDGEPGHLERLRSEARELLGAAAAGSSLRRLAAAHALPPTGARGHFGGTLEFLALWIRDLAATAAGAGDLVVNIDARAALEALAQRLPAAAAGAPAAIRAVDEALALTQINVNPQLLIHRLLTEVHHALHGRA